MKYLKPKELKMYCFSPPVMLATFIIEIALALWTVYRYKLNEVGKVVVALLLFLAAFQIAEYNVCETGWINSMLASRLGFAAITMLPPLGIHLVYALAGTKKRPLLIPAYVTGALFIGYFLFVGPALSGHECMSNYVIFQMIPESTWLYTIYYYGLIVAGAWLCFALQKQLKLWSALTGLAVGYMLLMIPTTTVNLIDQNTIAGIPSIMCGFAVFLALALAFWVMPRGGEKR
jgi:hypothetical protein